MEVINSTYQEKWNGINGEVKSVNIKIFAESEMDRAETIVNALKGLTIESAQELMNKVNTFLLQIEII